MKVELNINTSSVEKIDLDINDDQKLMNLCATLRQKILINNASEANCLKSFFSKAKATDKVLKILPKDINNFILCCTAFMGPNVGDDYIKLYLKPLTDSNDDKRLEDCQLIGIWSNTYSKAEKYFYNGSKRFI